MIRKLLVANRGEIACRVITAAHSLGISTVAVYSDADRDAKHVAMADEAHRLGPAPARESYLSVEAILAAAKASGADAIHPGYGFLSENEDFAAACAKAGIIFVGPPPSAIAAMGDKAAAKALMAKAGVPLVPGYHGDNQDPAFLAAEAAKIGYPVLIKASAGGGGKGMRPVTKAAEFEQALAGAQREAKAAFGDDRVLIEKYLARPRHIEIQVFGDSHGNVVHLYERDCSVQRRHQKVLEEAPAPGMTPERRKAMGDAAVSAAKAIGYVGAGTVEFIAEQDGTFFFMEMNTRLQVEHPVTEMITGLDLVQWQLHVAAGGKLLLSQDEIPLNGHAIEARIYAENAAKGFLPSTGTLRRLRVPESIEFRPGAPVRVDSGVREGDAITPFYDPMIAKLVCWGETRDVALARLRAALVDYEIVGPTSNVDFLWRVTGTEAFSSADLDTGLIERCRAELFPAARPAPDAILAAAAFAELTQEAAAVSRRAAASGDPYSPWASVDGWRLNLGSHHRLVFTEGKARHELIVEFRDEGYGLKVGDRRYALEGEAYGDDRYAVSLDGRRESVSAVRDGEQWIVFRGGERWTLGLVADLHDAGDAAAGGALVAPMPGKIVSFAVKAGDKVSRGAPLAVLEAMKMEHTISAPRDGKVAEVFFKPGDQVNEGAELLKLADA